MKHLIRLSQINKDENYKIAALLASGEKRRRLLSLGFAAGTTISVVLFSPIGGTAAYRLRGAVVALRNDDAAKILVQKAAET